MFKNTASQKLVVRCFDSTNATPKTGDAANLTAYVSIDNGAITVLGDTSATEISNTNAKGYYLFDLTQAETNGNVLLFTCKSTTANIVCVACPDVVQTVLTTNDAADALLDRTSAVETGLTLRGAFRLLCAMLGGKISGANSTSPVVRNAVADSKTRVSMTVDASGNRTAVTIDQT